MLSTTVPKLPNELVERVIHYIPIVHLRAKIVELSAMFGIMCVGYAARRRVSPLMYLRELCDDTRRLLEVMFYTNTFLGGSRAMEFFTPGLCVDHSSWSFFCGGGGTQRWVFLKYMRSIGFVPEGYFMDNIYGEYPRKKNQNVITGSLKSRNKASAVKLVSCGITGPLAFVLDTHSSINQCYISGSDAVDVRPQLSSLKVSHSYASTNRTRYEREKYECRGVKYMDSTEYVKFTRAISDSNNVESTVSLTRGLLHASLRACCVSSFSTCEPLRLNYTDEVVSDDVTTITDRRNGGLISTSWLETNRNVIRISSMDSICCTRGYMPIENRRITGPDPEGRLSRNGYLSDNHSHRRSEATKRGLLEISDSMCVDSLGNPRTVAGELTTSMYLTTISDCNSIIASEDAEREWINRAGDDRTYMM